MELENNLFIKSQENDVLYRGTMIKNIDYYVMRIVLLVGSGCLLYRLITVPEDPQYWYGVILCLLSLDLYKDIIRYERVERRRCIRKGEKLAAKLVDIESCECNDGKRIYTDYVFRFECLKDSKEYVVHFGSLDPREYIANPYCNLYVYEKKGKIIVAVKDFNIKPEHLSKSGYFLVK